MGNERPFLELTSITIACPAPRDLAAFYSRLLGSEVSASEPAPAGGPEQAGWAQVSTANLTLNFEFERQWTPPEWPAVAGHQFASQHVDIWVHDLDAAVGWALSCGATLAAIQPQADVRVLLDPAGKPFCLFL